MFAWTTHIQAYEPFCGTLPNSADPDQTPKKAACDQGLHCLFMECSVKIWIKMKYHLIILFKNENRIVLLTRVGNSTRLKWVKLLILLIYNFIYYEANIFVAHL